jgi:hypothetical protein
MKQLLEIKWLKWRYVGTASIPELFNLIFAVLFFALLGWVPLRWPHDSPIDAFMGLLSWVPAVGGLIGICMWFPARRRRRHREP